MHVPPTLVFAAEDLGPGFLSGTLFGMPVAELIGGIGAFLVVFLVVWRFALPSISKNLDERQAAIGGQIRRAEEAKAEAEAVREEYRAQLAGVKAEANQIVEEARQQAEQVRVDLVAKAEEEAARIRARAQADADAERDRVLGEARAEVASLSVRLAEKVIGASLDTDRQLALVDQYLAQLEAE